MAELVLRQGLIWNCWTTVTWGTKNNPGAKRAIITGSAITESSHRVRPNGLEDTPMFKVNVNAAKLRQWVWRCLISTRQFPPPSQQLRERLPQPGAGEKSVCPAGTPFRMLPDNINQWYVRNALARWHRFLPTRLPNGPMVHRTGTLQRHPVNGDFR